MTTSEPLVLYVDSFPPPWRNWLARQTVNLEALSSILSGGDIPLSVSYGCFNCVLFVFSLFFFFSPLLSSSLVVPSHEYSNLQHRRIKDRPST